MKPMLPWLAALAMLAAAALLGLGLAPAWRAEADALAQAVPPAPRRAPPPPPAPVLPAAAEPATRLADLLALALRHGVAVERVQQRLEPQPGVRQLTVQMSGRGRYADLRAFVAAALQADPALALQRVQWRRATPAQAELDAELHWALLQGDPR